MTRTRPTFRDQYATVQALLTSANHRAAELVLENGKLVKKNVDLQQRNNLLYDTNRLLNEKIHRLESELARSVRVDEIKTTDLRLAS